MTRGISEERLEELLGQGLPGVINFKSECLGFISILLRDECTELNPIEPLGKEFSMSMFASKEAMYKAKCEYLESRNRWQPIESAPLNKKLRLFKISGQYQCDDTLYGEEFRSYYSHWMELPENPK